MERIYFDNAATTQLDSSVLEAMMPFLTGKFGNPSSIYSYGRESKIGIEAARKSVAKILNAHPAEIFFTSGGTESNNPTITNSLNRAMVGFRFAPNQSCIEFVMFSRLSIYF